MEARSVTPDNWDDFLEVMGPRGGEAGCFCMFYRQTSREFEQSKGEANRELMREIVGSGQVPGLIGYRDGRPVGWVQVGPRERYPRLDRSRVTRPLDDRAAWAVTCFVIPKAHRRTGVASQLLKAAVEYARSEGAEVVEGYPVDPKSDQEPAIWSWMGFPSMFESCGFVEVARRSETRPFMRLELS